MKIYLAASFTERKRIRIQREKLADLGHQVISSWLEEPPKPAHMDIDSYERKMAVKDLQELATTHCFILDLKNGNATMGKMVEYGYAIATGKILYVVGIPPKHSIFTLLADKLFRDWDEAIKYIKANH